MNAFVCTFIGVQKRGSSHMFCRCFLPRFYTPIKLKKQFIQFLIIRGRLTSYSRCCISGSTWETTSTFIKKNNIVLIQDVYYPKFSRWMWQNWWFVFSCVYVGYASLQYLNVSFYLTLRMYYIELHAFNH